MGKSLRLTRERISVPGIDTLCPASPFSRPRCFAFEWAGAGRFALLRMWPRANPEAHWKSTLSRAAKMNSLVKRLARSPLLTPDLDYYLIRAAMVIVFVLFGYQKWFEYEARVLIPYISHGPLVFWLYPVFGIRGASWFLGVVEWLVAVLLFIGFWNRRWGILGAVGSIITFLSTVTIIPFMPNAWDATAGGFPAIAADTTAFLIKD